MRIPDPVELMDARVAAQIDAVTPDGKTSCAACGELTPLEEMHPGGPRPDSAPICGRCLDAEMEAANLAAANLELSNRTW
jgi:hypothetical protein